VGCTSGETPLLAAARGTQAWLAAGGARPLIRAALIRFWGRRGAEAALRPIV
jgi:hypothetical protein